MVSVALGCQVELVTVHLVGACVGLLFKSLTTYWRQVELVTVHLVGACVGLLFKSLTVGRYCSVGYCWESRLGRIWGYASRVGGYCNRIDVD